MITVQATFPTTGLPADQKLLSVEHRVPEVGEYYLTGNLWHKREFTMFATRQVAVLTEPEIKWRPATNEDVIRYIRGEVVTCRVRDQYSASWREGVLVGYVPTLCHPWYAEVTGKKFVDCFTQCEVPL